MVMFGFVGMNEFVGGNTTPTSTVITVGDGEVDGRAYQAEYRRVINRVSTAQGRRITYDEVKKEGLLKQVSENLITFSPRDPRDRGARHSSATGCHCPDSGPFGNCLPDSESQ